jgi:hypothetical protein
MNHEHKTFHAWFEKVKENGRQLSRTEFYLARVYGARQGDMAVFEASELGYQCPAGHKEISWSEFNEHIWCMVCELDILTRKCPIRKPDFMTEQQFLDFLVRLPFTPIIIDDESNP